EGAANRTDARQAPRAQRALERPKMALRRGQQPRAQSDDRLAHQAELTDGVYAEAERPENPGAAQQQRKRGPGCDNQRAAGYAAQPARAAQVQLLGRD